MLRRIIAALIILGGLIAAGTALTAAGAAGHSASGAQPSFFYRG